MSLLTFAQWLQSTDWASAIRYSSYTYPVIMSAHLACMGLFGGMILAGNLRLLDLALRRRTVSEIIAPLRVPKRIGFLLVATCGVLLASSKAEEYYYNKFFWAKMTVLALIGIHGLYFRRSVYMNPELDKAPRTPRRAKVAAVLSLTLWTCMVIAGRGIGYIEPPLDRLHAQIVVHPAPAVLLHSGL